MQVPDIACAIDKETGLKYPFHRAIINKNKKVFVNKWQDSIYIMK